jgi:hypothetical protein
MATDPNTVSTAKKSETVIEGMDSRRMFANVTEAAAYLNASATKFADFDSHPQVLRGIHTEGDNAGDFDSAIYTSSMRVMVAVLANRGEKKGDPSTVKAIVVTPAPTLDALMADDAGKAWVAKIIDKELNHVAVRPLRTADDVESVADQMPLTLADYITSSRESSGGIMDTFNALFKGIIGGLAAKSAPWAKARLIKSELKKAMESTAYAKEYYPTLEDRGDKPSLFVMALQLGKREAAKQGLDPAIFDRWLETRDSKTIKAAETADESDDFDLDDLAFDEPKEEQPAAPAEPATDSSTPATTA